MVVKATLTCNGAVQIVRVLSGGCKDLGVASLPLAVPHQKHVRSQLDGGLALDGRHLGGGGVHVPMEALHWLRQL